jgi:hypothetical protein
MIEWLKTLPPDAEVECGVEEWHGGYECRMVMQPVDIESCSVHDYTSDVWKAYPHFYGKIVVDICGD